MPINPNDYQSALEETGDPVAASLLLIAYELANIGIVLSVGDVAESTREIASAIREQGEG